MLTIPNPEEAALPNPSNIPSELKEVDQWVLWEYEIRTDKKGTEKLTKVPYRVIPWNNPTGKQFKASSTSPETWGSFENALNVLNDPETRGQFHGLGFMSRDLLQ